MFYCNLFVQDFPRIVDKNYPSLFVVVSGLVVVCVLVVGTCVGPCTVVVAIFFVPVDVDACVFVDNKFVDAVVGVCAVGVA